MAYPNMTQVDGSFGTFLAAEALPINRRVRFASGGSGDGQASIVLADATETAIGVTQVPIANAAQGLVKFTNSAGTFKGTPVGTIAEGGAIYAAIDGKVSSDSGGGALLLGMAATAGADGGTVVWSLAK